MNFKQARAASGLTQEAAGQLIGATRRAVQEWEGGRRNCPPAKLAYFLKCVKAKNDPKYSHLVPPREAG